MNIDNLTLGQIKQIQALLGNPTTQPQDGLNAMLGKKVIIRTYSAGDGYGCGCGDGCGDGDGYGCGN